MWGAYQAQLLFLLSTLMSSISAQPGFLSLDCGASESYTDDRGIKWTPDNNYTSTGIISPISSTLMTKNLDQYLHQLRYFPDKDRKHCYALPVEVGEPYLLRPMFYYGNYDGLDSSKVEFEIILGANKISIASLKSTSWWYYEYVVKATKSTIDLCFATSSKSSVNIPFVSAIELRQLDPGMRGSISNYSEILAMWRRINLGATSSLDIRYPSDPYDRIWRPDSDFEDMVKYKRISTNHTVSVGGTYNKPPSEVMRSAVTSDTAIDFRFPASLDRTSYYVNFYFAEFAALGNETREFTVYLNTSATTTLVSVSLTINVEKIAAAPFISVQTDLKGQMTLSEPTRFSLVPTPSSTLGPILNAAELFEYKGNLLPGTEMDDATSILELMGDFNMTGWSGDPCLPHLYAWTWIICDFSQIPARIIELNLSNQGLSGIIPDSIGKLKHLTKIYLDNNALTGRFPNLSSLKNLTLLSLQNNSLDCVPQGLPFSFNTSIPVCEIHHKHKKFIIGIIIPCAAVFLLGTGFMLWFFIARKKSSPVQQQNAIERDPSLSPVSSNKSLSYKDVLQATNNFEKIIGEGSFGPVYYGSLAGGVEVAVKVLSDNTNQGIKEFKTEVDILSVVHHKNLVSFLGYCDEGSKLLLIYEYMSKGTLRENLYGSGKYKHPTLSWKTRLRIALDAAQGLEYLHTSCNLNIIHRDIKTTNILLNSATVAKVGDFGLSKLFDKSTGTHISTLVKGTPGYLDPEYHYYCRLTEKSDVYSFGVVLFEIVCAREPIKATLPEEQVVLSKWACMEITNGNIRTLIDPKLMNNYKEQSAWKLLELAMRCVEPSSVNRPDMSTVVAELREAIQLEEIEDENSTTISMEELSRGR